MKNPATRLKEVLGELLLNGRLALKSAERQEARLEAALKRLEAIETWSASHPRPAHAEGTVAAGGGRAPETGWSYHGLDGLDRRLERYVDLDGGYFVELGANDGVSQSNTLHFERDRGWSGILVEPTPHNFLKCLANRSAQTRAFCCACTSFDYPHRFVELAFSNLMSAPVGLDSDVEDPFAHAQEGTRFLESTDQVFSFGALARPLNDLLVEACAPARMDLLSLDVEGAEIEVLKGIDHARFRFRYICIECRDIDRMQGYLEPLGYVLVERLSHHDYLFCDVSEPPAAPRA